MILYDTIVKIKKMKGSASSVRRLIATATGEASVQPLTQQSTELRPGTTGTLYVAYVSVDLPVAQGDHLSTPDGTTYIVREVLKRDNVPLPHQELTLNKEPQ